MMRIVRTCNIQRIIYSFKRQLPLNKTVLIKSFGTGTFLIVPNIYTFIGIKGIKLVNVIGVRNRCYKPLDMLFFPKYFL